jgi:chorismate synthase
MKVTDMEMAINPSSIGGVVSAPPSKSYTHRAIICASLAGGKSTIHNPLLSEDTEATIEACKELGAIFTRKSREELVIYGTGGSLGNNGAFIDCKESGSTLRFILPLVAMIEGETTITGREGLIRRPISDLVKAVEDFGGRIEYLQNAGSLPVKVVGRRLKGGQANVRGDVSSQFISGLLFALPLASGDSEIRVTTEMESADYVEMTIEMLSRFGISVLFDRGERVFRIKGGQHYNPAEYRNEGDFSSAAFMLLAGAIAGNQQGVTVNNLRRDSKQGDRRIIEILSEMGADIQIKDESVSVRKGELRGIKVDARNIPDLVPAVAVAGMLSSTPTVIEGIDRLELKESNRVSSILSVIQAFGGRAHRDGNSIVIKGSGNINPCSVPEIRDHRIVMAACIAGLSAKGETRVSCPTAVKKSYPEFFDDLRELGGDIMAVSNSFGNVLKLRLLGESHGKRIGAILHGIPEGITIEKEEIQMELERRRSISSLSTARREKDTVEIISGIENGRTTGGDIRLEIKNGDVKSDSYKITRSLIRPGHADFTAREKYASVFDYRGGGFLSGRMTAGLVAAGAISKKILISHDIKVMAHIVSVGNIEVSRELSDEEIERNRFLNFVRCADPGKAREMEKAIEESKREGDSLGGVIECRITGLPVGVGEPFFHSVESEISQAIFSIPAVKGIEFGSGFRGSKMKGSENNDPVSVKEGKVTTLTNNSGGILGGISNGMPVVFRVAIKPTSSISKEQRTVNYYGLEEAILTLKGRHDPCVAIRAPPVVEAMASLVITDLMIAGGFLEGKGW